MVGQHGEMKQDIAVDIVRHDEAESARRIEPFDLARHLIFLAVRPVLGRAIIGIRSSDGAFRTPLAIAHMIAHSHTPSALRV